MKRCVAGLLLAVLLFQASLATSFAQGRSWSDTVCVGVNSVDSDGRERIRDDVATIQGLECLIGNVLSVFFAVMGLAAFIMVVVGAMRILLSGGDHKGMDTGKKTITLAVIGIVVALSGFILVRLLSSFLGVDLLQFRIPRADQTIIGPGGNIGNGGGPPGNR